MDKTSKRSPCSCLSGARFNTGDAGQVGCKSWIFPPRLPVSLLALLKFSVGIEPSGLHGEMVFGGIVSDGVSGCRVCWGLSWHVVGCCSCLTLLQVGCESWVCPSGWAVLGVAGCDGARGCGVCGRSSWHVVGCCSCLTSSQVGCELWVCPSGWAALGVTRCDGVSGCGACWRSSWHVVGCCSCPTLLMGKARDSRQWDGLAWHCCSCLSLDTLAA